jgi:hypothetical protein
LAPQCFDICPLHRSVPGTHSPAHLPVAASQTNGHAFAWSSTQLPEPLHVCGLPALHCFWFGVHARHWPMLHGVAPQDILSFQCPVASHDWIMLLEHISAVPGAHSPPHFLVAASHTNVHAAAGPQTPIALHVSNVVVEPAAHRVAFGAHSPVH